MTVRSEVVRYWRTAHAKYSHLNDLASRQKRAAVAKKLRQRTRERDRLSFYAVVFFMALSVVFIVVNTLPMEERSGSVVVSDKKREEFDSVGEAQEYLANNKNVVQIDSYHRQELSVKDKNDVITKNVDETRVRVKTIERGGRNLVWKSQRFEKSTYFDSTSPAHDARWMAVVNDVHKFFVYSAYYDDRKGKMIRIIGATRTKRGIKVWCKYWYANSTTLILEGAVKVIRENWNLRYSACFVACPLTVNKNGKLPIPPPESVSVMSNPGGNATNKLLIRNLDVVNSKPKDSFAVCVKPLHFDYNNVNQIVEFIELNRLLGVEHFTLYNHTISEKMSCILKDYIEKKIVTVLPWNLSIQSQKEIRTEGLFAALNDCLYRYMHSYKYILMIDLDEYIVPHANMTLPEMVSFLATRADQKKVGAISFQNAFFYLQWPDHPDSANLPPLTTQRKTSRRQRLHPHKQRSKYIAISPYVVEAGNHFVWEFLPARATLNVPGEVAFLHHYRVCEFGGDDCVKSPKVTDTTLTRFRGPLVTAFEERLLDLTEKCALSPDLGKT